MTDRTTEQLVNRAATEMGMLYSGQALDDADFDRIEEVVEPLVEQLNAEEIAYIDDIDAIEPKVFLPLARLVAIEAAQSFGNGAIQNLLTNSRSPNLDALREREHATLRRIYSTRPTGEASESEYF